MRDELAATSVAALRAAAERLGVDPYRLAHYLDDGRLAEVLEALGRPESVNQHKLLGLAESYLDFLEREIQIQEGHRPSRPRRRL